MDITPDSKDWTWVLDKPCPDCGLDASSVRGEQLGERLLGAARALADTLAGPSAAVRPAPRVWSALEYACHVRDLCRIFAGRLELMLTTDDPAFANWDQDQTAVELAYGGQHPAAVAGELWTTAQEMSRALGTVAGEQWNRTGLRGDGARFTVLTLGQYLVHDPVHHLWDVTGRRQG